MRNIINISRLTCAPVSVALSFTLCLNFDLGDRRLQWDWEMHCYWVLQARSVHHFGGTRRGKHKHLADPTLECSLVNRLFVVWAHLMSHSQTLKVNLFHVTQVQKCMWVDPHRSIITCFHLVVEFMTFIMIFASFCVYNSKHAFYFSCRRSCFRQRRKWRNLPSMTSRYGFSMYFNKRCLLLKNSLKAYSTCIIFPAHIFQMCRLREMIKVKINH